MDNEDTEINDELQLLPADKGIPENNSMDENQEFAAKKENAIKKTLNNRYVLEIYDLDLKRIISRREMPERVGKMMPVVDQYIIAFSRYPKLIEIATGKVLFRWEDIDSGPDDVNLQV